MTCPIVGGHQLRVTLTSLSPGDHWPTWHQVPLQWATWADVVAGNPTWADLLNNTGPNAGVGVVDDITDDVTGLHVVRGRENILDHPRAGTLSMTLRDDNGEHDPRVLPGGPSRVGSKIEVEVMPAGGSWTDLGVFFVEEWRKDLDANGDEPVTVEASDALHLLARAVARTPPTSPAGANELAGARVDRCLDAVPWLTKWGTRSVEAGVTAMNPTMHQSIDAAPDETTTSPSSLLDEMHRVTRSEDGMLDVAADGTVRWRGEGWRDRIVPNDVAAVVDLTGLEQAGPIPVLCPSRAPLGVSDLGSLASRVSVNRSVQFDPDRADGSRPSPVTATRESDRAVNRYGPLTPVDLTGLPHNTNGRSAALAQRLVDRLSAEPGVLGEFDLELTKRPADAAPTVALDWGRPLWVVDTPIVGYGRELTTVEVCGIEHDITPEVGWRAKLLVDRWVGATPSTPTPQPVGAFDFPSFDRQAFDTAEI